MITHRPSLYLWPTWISGLLAAERQCQWAAWLKAHYKYEKVPDANENRLAFWRADHAEMVRTRAEDLRTEEYAVFIEGQNEFHYHGDACTVGGCPDIVAVRNAEARIDDCKTGRESEADFWQVCIYGLLAPLTPEHRARFKGASLTGTIIYKQRERSISAKDMKAARDPIIRQVLLTAGPDEPRRTPSARECRYCDILDCPDRIGEHAVETEPPAEGVLF